MENSQERNEFARNDENSPDYILREVKCKKKKKKKHKLYIYIFFCFILILHRNN